MAYSTTVKCKEGYTITSDQSGRSYLNAIQGQMSVIASKEAPASTPSAMGHFLQFYNVVSSNAVEKLHWGELYDRYVDEWRSIIAMLALSDTLGYNIKFQPVELPEEFSKSNLFLSICGSDAIIPSAEPTSTSDDHSIAGTSWRNLHNIIINYDPEARAGRDVSLGITHPWTLVCPAKNSKSPEAAGILEKLRGNKDLCIAVFQWLARIQQPSFNNTVTRLILDFETDLAHYIGDPGYQSRIDSSVRTVDNSFSILDASGKMINDGLSDSTVGFGRINFTMHKKVSPAEWYAFFTALALNDIRGLGIEYKDGNFTVAGKPITTTDSVTMYIPNGSIDANSCFGEDGTTFGYTKDPSAVIARLSSFERTCLLGWLLKLQSHNWSADAHELVTHISDLIKIINDTKLKGEMTDKETDDRVHKERQIAEAMLLSGNRFYTNAEDASDPFRYTAHKRNAAFFDAKNDELGETIRAGWFNTLSLLALKDIRGLNIEINPMPALQAPYPIIKSDMPGCFVDDGANYQRHEISLNGKPIAASSRSMLLELREGAEKEVADAYNSLNIRMHEQLLVACWLDKALQYLGDTSSKSINFEASDYLELDAIINKKKQELLQGYTIDELRENKFLDGFFTVEDASGELTRVNTTLKYFYHRIIDNVFEKELVLFSPSNTIIDSNALKNGDGETSVYQVWEDVQGKKEKFDAQYLLPFTDNMVRILDEAMYDKKGTAFGSIKEADGKVAEFSLKYVNAYWLGESQEYEVSFEGNGSLPPFPISKRFATGMVREDKFLLGTASVWPEVEIEGFSGYKLTYVTLATGSERAKLEKPPGYADDLPTTNVQIVGDAAYNVNSYKMGKFPRFIRFSHAGASGLMFSSPERYHETNDKGNSEAIIAIDFGTSNTMVYIKPDTDSDSIHLNLDDVNGKLLTRATIPNTLLPAFFQLKLKDGIGGDFFPTACMSIHPDVKAEPLMNGNLYRFTFADLAGDEGSGSILDALNTKLVREFKMTDRYEHEMALLFKQLISTACIAIVTKHNPSVKQIKVRVSYPIALDKKVRDIYKKHWKDALIRVGEEFKPENGSNVTVNEKIMFFAESYCAAQASKICYPAGAFNPISGYLVVDVGGGTTDIALVQGNTTTELRVEMSVKYAARVLLRALYIDRGRIQLDSLVKCFMELRYSLIARADVSLKQDKKFIVLFGDPNNQNSISKALPEKPVGKEGAIISLIRRVLKAEGKFHGNVSTFSFDFERLITTLDSAIKLCQSSNSVAKYFAELNPEGSKFQPKAKLASGALFYFIGALMKKFKDKKDKAGNEIYTGNINNILVSGNGSRMLEWLNIGDDAPSCDQYLAKFYLAGLDSAKQEQVNIVSSINEKRKHETAAGLLEAPDDAGKPEPEKASGLMPDIGAIFGKENDVENLKLALLDAFESSGMPSPEFVSNTVKDVKEEAQKLVNPDFEDAKLEEEIFRFLKAFYSISRTDFRELFGNVVINTTKPIDDESNKSILAKVKECRDAATIPSSGDITFPIESANEYIVLASVLWILGSC